LLHQQDTKQSARRVRQTRADRLAKAISLFFLLQQQTITDLAKGPGKPWPLQVRAHPLLLYNKGAFRIIGRFCSHMLHPPLPVTAQKIEPQTVLIFIDLIHQPEP